MTRGEALTWMRRAKRALYVLVVVFAGVLAYVEGLTTAVAFIVGLAGGFALGYGEAVEEILRQDAS